MSRTLNSILSTALVAALLILPGAASAVEITPQARGTSEFGVGIHVTNLVDGSGLNDVNATPGTALDDVHDFPSDGLTMWHSGDADAGIPGGLDNDGDPFTAPLVSAQILEFDLGRIYDLTAAHIWQMNQGDPGFGALAPARGVDQFEVLVSPDAGGATFASLGTFNLAAEAGTADVPAQVLAMNAASVRRVRFALESAHSGLDTEFVGLSEVRFEGVRVPEPTTTAICALAALSALAARRVRR